MPVEIQVRTTFQDLWEQIFENLADQWGRQIRYGEPPNSPAIRASMSARPDGTEEFSRVEFMEHLKKLSDDIAAYESVTTDIVASEGMLAASGLDDSAGIRKVTDELDKLWSTPEAGDSVKEWYADLRNQAINFCRIIEADKRRRGRLIRRWCPRRENPEVSDIKTLFMWLVPLAAENLAHLRREITRHEGRLRSTLTLLAKKTNEVR